ncbi:hypothetical protein M973_04440 [Francisella orientalis LADL 07-285A]|nr:hypothetical protein M973_04440 [Francisella orientalis LADL 07-285A]
MYYGFSVANDGVISGNYTTLSYVLISISELFVSAIGLSMIGIYCDSKTIGFAMGAWYISSSMANSITGLLNQVVSVMFVGVFVLILAYCLIRFMRRKNIEFV